MEKNQNIKYEYVLRNNNTVKFYSLTYEEAQAQAKKSLEGLDIRLLKNKEFIKSIMKETKDKAFWVRIDKELKKDIDICAVSLLRGFIIWTDVDSVLKKDKRIICAAAHNFKNQELFEPYGVSRSPELLAYILERPKMPLHHNVVKHWVKNDRVMEIIVNKKPYFYKEASSNIRNNINIAKKAVIAYPHYLGLETDLWSDKKLAKEFINEFNINYSTKEIQTDHEIILPIIKRAPHLLMTLCEEAKNDPVIVLNSVAAQYFENNSKFSQAMILSNYSYNKCFIGEKLLTELKNHSLKDPEQVEYLLKLANFKDIELTLQIDIKENMKKMKVKI